MGIIKITNVDDDTQTTCNLLGYSFLSITDKIAILEINTTISSLKYRIWTDDNAPDINKIKSFIFSKFDAALVNNIIIYFKEEHTRNYISFIDNGKIEKQFSGRKI